MNRKAAELRALSTEELRTQLEEARREQFNLRFRLATRQAANTSELNRVRRQIARIHTLLREQEFEAGS